MILIFFINKWERLPQEASCKVWDVLTTFQRKVCLEEFKFTYSQYFEVLSQQSFYEYPLMLYQSLGEQNVQENFMQKEI